MLKKALTTTALATVLLTSSISANELATQGFSGSTAKVETIGAFDNIPTQGLSSSELNEEGQFAVIAGIAIVGSIVGIGTVFHYYWKDKYGDDYYIPAVYKNNNYNNYNDSYYDEFYY